MRVALVYDRVNKLGGAERVLTSLKKIYPDAPIYTLVHNSPTAIWSKNYKIIPTFFNHSKWLRSHHELLAPLAGLAFETFNFDQFDLVISVTSADAKAIITKPSTLHLCYCLTPTRYLWNGVDEYRRFFGFDFLFNLFIKYARRADLVYASRPDQYLAISKEVGLRISKYYDHKSEIIYPPINYEFFSKTRHLKKDDFYLVVSRLVPYKKIDIVIEAFNQIKKRLLIVGAGSEEKKLKSHAGENIEFLGLVDDLTLSKYYARAKALIFPQTEDFGLTPLEAAATGTPTLAYSRGGVLETVVDGYTGLFFAEQTPDSIINTIHRFESGHHQISAKHCKERALEFAEDRFIAAFSAKVNSQWQKHQKMFS